MKKKKLLVLLGSICLVLVLVALPFMAACAKPAPPPKPAPALHEPYEIDIYTFVPGAWAYVMGVALAEFINKDSKWLKAIAVKGSLPDVNTKMLVMKPEMRKDTLIHGNITSNFDLKHSSDKFEGLPPYTDLRNVAQIGPAAFLFITTDPNIKTLNDLSGKRVAVGTKPSMVTARVPQMLLEQAGTRDIHYSFLGFAEGVAALRDGLVDACVAPTFAASPKLTKFIPIPALFELMQVKPTYFIPFEKSHLEAITTKAGNYPSQFVPIKPGALSATQTETVTGWSAQPMWVGDVEMPDDVVYEILRAYLLNIDKFREYNPLGELITRETMGLLGDEEDYHLGALKFYKDNGIPTGWFKW